MAVKKAGARRGRERRVSERADARLSMRVDAGALAGATRIVTESQNISASGVYCHASHYLAPLSKVQLTIVLPRVPGGDSGPPELVKCEAIVVRCGHRTEGKEDDQVGDEVGHALDLEIDHSIHDQVSCGDQEQADY